MDTHADLHACIDQPPAAALVVGFSGGLDSTVLLHLLAGRWRPHLRALHIDHGLQRQSGHWADHCRGICQALDIPLAVVAVRVQADGSGLEAAARRARWHAYAEQVDPEGEALVLGHHRDDQAETVLLRLLRGAGPAGLSAMAVSSRRANGLQVWRPLLSVARARLHDYARSHGLAWIDDPSNAAEDAERNILRNRAMPLLRQRWPGLDATLAQVAQRQTEAHGHERRVGGALLAQARTHDERILRWPVLLAAPITVRHAALRHWLAAHGCPGIGHQQLTIIDRELLAAAADGAPRIRLAGHILRRHDEHLYLLDEGEDQPLVYDLPWDGLAPLVLPGGARLSIQPAPAQPLALVAASRRGGERLQLQPDGPRRRLKSLLQEAGIPPWQRQRWPVIWLDGEPVAFADRLTAATLAQRLPGQRLVFQP